MRNQQFSDTDRATAYAQAVVAGRIIAGKPVRQACERHLQDLKNGHERGLRYDAKAAAKVIRFFEQFLILPETEGQPFILQPSQAFIIGCLFGWKAADGTRRFRTAYIEMGKGNGKSPLAAGVGIYGLVADGEPAAQIFSAAVNRDQAKILFTDAVKMVESSQELSAIVQKRVGNLAVSTTGSFFRPVSADRRGLDGKRVHMALVDEVHEHPTPIVVDKMRAGTKGRKQALIFEITNSGYDRESVCWHHHEYSIKLMEGNAQNDSWFAYVCQLDEGDSWIDPAVWIKANPNLGVSIPEKYLAEQVKEALDVPAKENIVKRLNFCIWTEQSTRAIQVEQWDLCNAPVEIGKGEQAHSGLDLASTTNKAAFVMVFAPREDKPWRIKPTYWVPAAQVAERLKRGDSTYDTWVKAGFLKTTPGNVIDYDQVRKDINELATEYNISEIAKDPWNSTQIGTQLSATDGMNVFEFRQNMNSYTAPTKELLGAIASRNLAHGGHPVLRADAANLALMQDSNGNLKPDRDESGGDIDGIVSALMGMGRAMVDDSGPSVYESRGVIVI